ncbi:membrane-spanning 4-domains subfamily A member 13 isoform X1 [Prionailurus iriomotensis]
MAVCVCSKLSTADGLVLGAVQIMIGIFHVFMWYFLLILYMGQIRGVFGAYEPITYKAGCPLWGVIVKYFLSPFNLPVLFEEMWIQEGIDCDNHSRVSIIRVAKHPTPGVFGDSIGSCNKIEDLPRGSIYGTAITFALVMNISCIITSVIASVLTIIELSSFNSVSYRNYGQAKLGREVSRILLLSYSFEISVALTYAIFGCIGLSRHNEDSLTAVPEEFESTF